MTDSSRILVGVNAPALSAAELARWDRALGVVLGRWTAADLPITDLRALEAYSSLAVGRWLEAVLWLGRGLVVDAPAALADPMGALLAAVVLRVVGPVVTAAHAGRAGPFWRSLALAHLDACQRRPQRDPMTWAVESLLRAGGGRVELEAVELAVGERLEAGVVARLVELRERDWEAEALARELGRGANDDV